MNDFAQSILERYELKYNSNQPRGKDGKWTSGGDLHPVTITSINVTRKHIDAVRAGISTVPQSVRDKVQPTVRLSDDMDSVRSQRENKNVNGSYSYENKTITIPEKIEREGNTYETRTSDKIASTVRHEYGHAVDHHFQITTGTKLSQSPSFVETFKNIHKELAEFISDGDYDEFMYVLGKPSEFVAEAFNIIVSGTSSWGEDMLDFMQDDFYDAFEIVEEALLDEFGDLK